VSGAKACAATPPKSAFACSVVNARATTVAGSAAEIPKRARPIGCFGTWRIGANMSSASASKVSAAAPKSRFHARPSPAPSPSAVRSIERSMTPALPSSSGWARSTSG
jgi:hypothetical protein